MGTDTKLRIFVAMPFDEVEGDWKDQKEIKTALLEPILKEIDNKLGRDVELILENEKAKSGDVFESMYNEAIDADVYIADLTGLNANVAEELGVRWALKDNITIILCQQDLAKEPLPHNFSKARAIQYGSSAVHTNAAIKKVVEQILAGLNDPDHCDSPVRQVLRNKPVDMQKYNQIEQKNQQLENEIVRLKGERGEDLYINALKTTDNDKKIEWLAKAIQINSVFWDAYLELGKTYRITSKYEKAIEILTKAVTLNPNLSDCYRELGVAYSKNKQLELASEALDKAVSLNPQDYDALSSLAGVYRRLGMKNAPSSIDWKSFRESRDCYDKASKIKQDFDTYPLLNVARLRLILSKQEPDQKKLAVEKFDETMPLCLYELNKATKDWGSEKDNSKLRLNLYWRIFDYADSLLFSGKIQEGLAKYQEGIDFVSPDERESVLSSVVSPLKDFITLEVLEDELKKAVEEIIEKLEKARKTA